jgi:hypothetical protein
MNDLRLYEDYTRQAVHDILAPDKPFTADAGSWGRHEIVRVAERAGDFVFFVTLGQEQAEKEQQQWVTQNGILHWESQPHQKLDDRWIQGYIRPSDRHNHIHLFLRTSEESEYTYLGELKYLSHDPSQEQPVRIRWQILNWHIPRAALQRMGLTLRRAEQTGGKARGRES